MAISSFSDQDLDFFVENNLNVLFSGKHGVGKTHLIMDTFRRNGLNALYLSGGTLDPWVDVVGVPRPVKNRDGQVYLELVRPKAFVVDEIEAIFIDEYSRTHKRVRNAVMELIQFKSINGHKLPHLRVVWAAINPADEEGTYDAEKIDPAQQDRFQVQIDVPYKPTRSYFAEKFGHVIADAAVEWWEELPTEVKDLVSPRRLDYALEMHQLGGDLAFVLPSESNPFKLNLALIDGPLLERLEQIADDNDEKEAQIVVKEDPNVVDCVMKNIGTSKESFAEFWLSYIPSDNIAAMMYKDDLALYNIVSSVTASKAAAKVVTSLIRTRDSSLESYELCAALLSPRKRRGVSLKPIAGIAKNNPYKGILIETCTSLGIVIKDQQGNYKVSDEHLSIPGTSGFDPTLSSQSMILRTTHSTSAFLGFLAMFVKDYLLWSVKLPKEGDSVKYSLGETDVRILISRLENLAAIDSLASGMSLPPTSDMGCVCSIAIRSLMYDFVQAVSVADSSPCSSWMGMVCRSMDSSQTLSKFSDALQIIQAVNGGLFDGVTAAAAKKVKATLNTRKGMKRTIKAKGTASPRSRKLPIR